MKKIKVSELELLDINLQLFAEDDDSTTDTDDSVVDYQEDDLMDEDPEDIEELDDREIFNLDDEEDEEEKDQDVAEPGKKTQSHEENAQFKKMRLKAEEQAAKKLEAERQEIEAEKLRIAEEKRKYAEIEKERKIEASITQEKIWEKVNETGVTEEAAKKMLLIEAREEARRKADAIESQKKQFRNKPFFNDLENDIDKIIDQNSTVDVNTAYKYLIGERWEELSAQKDKNIEKRTIANVQDRMKRRSVPSTSSGGQSTTSLSKTTLEINRVLGVDSRDVAKHKKKNADRFKLR